MVTNLYEYYTGQGKVLPKTAEERFADPAFAAAAKSAGYDASTYKVNAQNKDANNKILGFLKGGSTTPPVTATTPPAGSPPAGTPTGGIVTNNPGGTPPPASTVTPYFSRYDKKITDIGTRLEATTGVAPDKATILAEKRANADSMIKQIQAEFQRELARENEAGAGRNDRVRALNISGGLGGSNFASANALNQEGKNKNIVDLMEKENSAKITAILADVDSRASDAYKEELATYRSSLEGDLERQTKLKDDMRKKALESFAGLAGSGVTLDQLKANEPEAYKQLQEEFGGNDLEMKAAYNNSLPDEMRTKYTTQTIKGKNGNAVIHRYGINPLTKKLEQEDFDTGQDYNTFTNLGSDIKEIGGAIYRVSKDGSQFTRLASVEASPKAGGGSVTSGAPAQTVVDQFEAILNDTTKDATGYSVKGDDTYVDPQQYVNAFNRWTSKEIGGSRDSFLKKFPPSQYVNPAANGSLPTYLRNLKNQPKTKTGTGREIK